MPDEKADPLKAEKKEPTDPQIVGLKRSDWIKLAVGLIIAIGTYSLGAISKSPNLIFTVAEPAQFQGAKNQTGIITFIISNTGWEDAEQVSCTVDLGKAKFDETESSDLNVTQKSRGSKYQFDLPNLASGATWKLSVLVSNVTELPTPLIYEIKSKTVIGVPSSKPVPMYKSGWFWIILFVSGIVTFIVGAGVASWLERALDKKLLAPIQEDVTRQLEQLEQMREAIETISSFLKPQLETQGPIDTIHVRQAISRGRKATFNSINLITDVQIALKQLSSLK